MNRCTDGSFGGRVLASIALSVSGASTALAAGTWTQVTALAPAVNAGCAQLLSDGTVICMSDTGGSGIGNLWYRLTPDIHGSYIHGTWSVLPVMHNTRLYFSSQMLMDGRLYVAGGEYGSGGSAAEVYDPVANTWTLTSPPGAAVGDANSAILPDGRVLQALVTGSLKSTKIYNPATNGFTVGPTCLGQHAEAAWMKLPDSSILFVNFVSTSSERYIPATNTWINDGTVPVNLYDSFASETGAAVLLPDGRAFFMGAPGTTAFYLPTGTSAPGTWTAGPVPPGPKGAPDGPMAMMSNGKVLCALSPVPSASNLYPTPTSFWEFDPGTNAFTQVGAPGGGLTINDSTFVFCFLDLPDGSVLSARMGTQKYYVYTPDGSPVAAGKPTISSVINTGGTQHLITGTQFNGISEGASYGDDWQMNTNYPIVRLTATVGTNVYYARTSNWNSTGVATGSMVTTTNFNVPATLPYGKYSLVVVANGIASTPIPFGWINPACPEDLNGDGIVDGADLGALLSNWGGTGYGDINNDGIVDGADLGLLLAHWGAC